VGPEKLPLPKDQMTSIEEIARSLFTTARAETKVLESA